MITIEEACKSAIKSGGDKSRINGILDIGDAWLITIADKTTGEVPDTAPFCIAKETGKHQPYFAPRDYMRCKNGKEISIPKQYA